MKIRKDFVTNSSSSSFVTIFIEDKTFARIMEKYLDFFEGYGSISVEQDNVKMSLEETYISCPQKKIDIFSTILELFGDEFSNEDESDEFIDSYYNDDDDNERVNIIKEIRKNKKQFNSDLIHAEISSSEIGWGGDDDSRFDKENYSKETLECMYEEIAKQNNCGKNDITDEQFFRYVASESSSNENSFFYDKNTNEENYNHEYNLL